MSPSLPLRRRDRAAPGPAGGGEPAPGAAATGAAAGPDAGGVAEPDRTGRPGGKGRPTPKRRDAEKRRTPVGPPPATRKEASARRKERVRAERTAAREGMARGDQRYLPARDRGPERALVRDLVDSRRTASTLFLPSAVLIIATSFVQTPLFQQVAYFLWLFVLVSIAIDSVVLGRLVTRRVREEFPESRERGRSLVFYAVMRALQLRRLRVPTPRVDPGDPV